MRRLALVLLVACGGPAKPAPITSTPLPPPVPHAGVALDRDPSAPATCGTLDTKLAGSTGLIADRLALTVPAPMRSLERAYSIMSAPKPREEEERLMLGGARSAGKEAGDSAFVILARETWQLDPERSTIEADAVTKPGKLGDEAPKFMRAVFADDLEVEAVTVGDPAIRAWAGRRPQVAVEDGADAALVLGLVLALPDATLVTVGFHVTPDLAGDPGCVRLAERIAATLVAGTRKLERGAGVRKLGGYKVTVPADYVAVHQPGPDFDLYTLYHLRPLSLYPGHILFVFDAHGAHDEGDEVARGKLLGKPVVWRGSRSDRGGSMSATVMQAPPHQVHVEVVATRQEKYLDQFRGVAETLAR